MAIPPRQPTGWDALKAINTAYLFDQIGFSDETRFNVGSIGRCFRGQDLVFEFTAKTKTFKDGFGFFYIYAHTQTALNICFSQGVDRVFPLERILVNDALDHLTACPFLHSAQTQTEGLLRQRGMHIAAKAIGRLAVDAIARAGFANINEVPGRRFEQDLGRFRADARFLPAHHASQTEWTSRVSHQLGLTGQGQLMLVQGGQLFTLFRPTRDDRRLAIGALS